MRNLIRFTAPLSEPALLGCFALVVIAVLSLATATPLLAQDERSISIDLTARAGAVSTVSASGFHIKFAATDTVRSSHVDRLQGASRVPFRAARPQAASATVPSVPSPGFYPSDLDYFGGPVLTNMESNNIYVNTSSCGSVRTCWGNPRGFLRDLNESTFIRLTDQYTGTSGNYEVGDSVSAKVSPVATPVGTQITQDQIIALVHDAASEIGTGYGHEYHVFLPAGIATCRPGNKACYSPNNPSTFVFCAYHGFVDFTDIGHVILSVEPFQNVPGCAAAPPNPNGALADSTNSVLSHELIESITDPDLDAWIADNSSIAAGAEIGDLCVPTGNAHAQFLDSYVSLNGHPYEMQLEYSNAYHACAGAP